MQPMNSACCQTHAPARVMDFTAADCKLMQTVGKHGQLTAVSMQSSQYLQSPPTRRASIGLRAFAVAGPRA